MIQPMNNPKLGMTFYSRYPYTPYFIWAGLAGKQHQANDYICPIGTPLKAVTRIQVYKVFMGDKKKQHPDYGNCVYAHAMDFPGLDIIYAHCSSIAYPQHLGKIWHEGEVFAWSGNTGKSSAPHLHLEFRLNGVKVDPNQFIK